MFGIRPLNLRHRRRLPELMDEHDLPAAEHRAALTSLARINWASRSSRILERPLVRTAKSSSGGSRLRVLDLACGSGDILLALAKRMQRLEVDVEWIGVDVSPVAVEFARSRAQLAQAPVQFLQADVLQDHWPEACDVVMCSLFLHHLDEEQALHLLRRMRKEARRQVLVNDLKRGWMGYLLAQAACRVLSRSRIVHFDGPVSVAGAFTIAEAKALALQAGMTDARIERRWPQRFLLDWRRT